MTLIKAYLADKLYWANDALKGLNRGEFCEHVREELAERVEERGCDEATALETLVEDNLCSLELCRNDVALYTALLEALEAGNYPPLIDYFTRSIAASTDADRIVARWLIDDGKTRTMERLASKSQVARAKYRGYIEELEKQQKGS